MKNINYPTLVSNFCTLCMNSIILILHRTSLFVQNITPGPPFPKGYIFHIPRPPAGESVLCGVLPVTGCHPNIYLVTQISIRRWVSRKMLHCIPFFSLGLSSILPYVLQISDYIFIFPLCNLIQIY